MVSEMLRKIAADLRVQAAEEEKARMEKCGQVLLAAQALVLLRGKVTSNG